MRTHWHKPFLEIYATAPLEIQKKARILFIVNLIITAAYLASGITINLVVVLHLRTALLEIGAGLCLLGTLYILRAGYYLIASSVTIATMLASLIIAGFCGYSGDPMLDFALLGMNVLPIIFYSCLIGCRKRQPMTAMTLCLAANAAYFIFVLLRGPGIHMAAGHYALLINSSLLIVVSGIMSYYIMDINHEVIAIADNEARNLREKTDQLEKAEDRFRTIFNTVNDAILIHDIDTGEILDVNRKMSEMYGYLPEEACRLTVEALSAGIPPYTQKEALAWIRRARSDGPQIFEWKARKRDGKTFWVEVNMRPARISGKERLLVTVRDMTERKTAEEMLATEKERLLVTLRSIGDGVITTDVDSRIVLMNTVAEGLTGWTQAEAAGQPLPRVFNIVNEKTRAPCENPVEKVLQTGRIIGLANHTMLIARNGVERSIADSGAPICDIENRIIGVVLVFRDITEWQRMQENLENTARLEALGTLAGGIAHDFNNLLTGLFGYIELARDSASDNRQTLECLDKAVGVFGRAKDLTRQLLTFSKGNRPVKKTMGLELLLKKSVHFVLSGSPLDVTFQIQDDLWLCDIDENQIAQVIDNIVINAQQAMPHGGTIEIIAVNVPATAVVPPPVMPGNYVRISIRDQGIGIKNEHLSHIFDPFFTTKQEGSGLGLTTAYSVVHRHDGYLTVDSELGKGSTFHIYLPAATQGLINPVFTPALSLEGQGHILIMDDEPSNRDVLQRMLKVLGYSCACAQNGKEAIAFFEAARGAGVPFDAVILDLTVPGGMGGHETILHLLQIDPMVKAIAASGYSNDPVMTEPMSFGFKASLYKPPSKTDLGRILKHILSSP